jgi:ketosteroid isomerase-like protein
MRKLALAFGLSALLAAPALAANPDEKAVLAAMDAWKQAMIKKDRAAFDKVLHPDLVYGHSNGNLEDKAVAIKQVVDGAATWEEITFTDTKVRVRGTTAMVTGKVQYREREAGKLEVVNLAVLSVWVKGAPGWQMIARQATRPTPSVITPIAAPPAKK